MASPIDVGARVTAGLAPLRGGSCSQNPPEKVPGDRRLYGDALTGRSEAVPSQLFEYLIACRQAGSRHIRIVISLTENRGKKQQRRRIEWMALNVDERPSTGG
jgi:hypothetical protein